MKNTPLLIAGGLSFSAALAHIAVIFGGPDWYRAFGAGEQLATMAAQGKAYPTIITLAIAAVLTTWALYALSGAKLIIRLPLLRSCLVLISAVYCTRGIYGFFLPFVIQTPHVQAMGLKFWFTSSSICLVIGLFYAAGLKQAWPEITLNKSRST
ncbi:hypothetical protein [Agaribacterium haliotis]|uniref:hypothetical protein n=1 Tax=Agaribacterium haliotis TaxID=2013869 RepID=UPI000BB54DE9|nr:hypothetical protein [Agaribacterium haliotis]